MKLRILTGAIGAALIFVVLLALPALALNFAMAVICAMAMVELLVTTKYVRHRGLLALSVAFSACTPFFTLGNSRMPVAIVLLLYVTALVCLQVMYHETLPVEHTGFAFFVSVTFPVAFSCLAYLRGFSERDGIFYVFLAIIMPWMCDMGAYFVGTFLGRHKLCPGISPKKTVEGLIGGIVISVLSSVLAGFLYQMWLGDTAAVNLWQIALLALVCAPLSVFGDLFASIIKRQCKVKDFGNIMPGHGGVMDRFDSLMLAVPLMYIVVHYLPLVY